MMYHNVILLNFILLFFVYMMLILCKGKRNG